jgi:hypothetical protein
MPGYGDDDDEALLSRGASSSGGEPTEDKAKGTVSLHGKTHFTTRFGGHSLLVQFLRGDILIRSSECKAMIPFRSFDLNSMN